jgi:hypothetical protein
MAPWHGWLRAAAVACCEAGASSSPSWIGFNVLGFGELSTKALHPLRLVSVSSDDTPRVGAIVEELLHLRLSCEVSDSPGENLSFGFR